MRDGGEKCEMAGKNTRWRGKIPDGGEKYQMAVTVKGFGLITSENFKGFHPSSSERFLLFLSDIIQLSYNGVFNSFFQDS